MAGTVTPRFTVTGAATVLGFALAAALFGLSPAHAEGPEEQRATQLLKAAGIDPAAVPEKDTIGIIAGPQKTALAESGQPQAESPKSPAGRTGAASPKTEPTENGPVRAETPNAALARADGGATEPSKTDRSAGLADPTRPPQQAVATTTGVAAAPMAPRGNRLQSVVYGPRRRIAILDGREVREGTVVGASRVVQIQRDGVILETGAKRERLSLYPNVVKKPRPQLSVARKRASRAKHHD